MRFSRNRTPFNPGHWEIERERARIENPRPPHAYTEPSRLGDVIPGLMRRLGMDEEHDLSLLREEWPALVGGAVAAHTRAGRWEGGALVVFVDSSVWLYELERTGRKPLLANVQTRLGRDRVQSVVFRLDPEGVRAQHVGGVISRQ